MQWRHNRTVKLGNCLSPQSHLSRISKRWQHLISLHDLLIALVSSKIWPLPLVCTPSVSFKSFPGSRGEPVLYLTNYCSLIQPLPQHPHHPSYSCTWEPYHGSLIQLIKAGPKALVTVHLFPHALYHTHDFHLWQHVQMSWICHVQYSMCVRILMSLSASRPENTWKGSCWRFLVLFEKLHGLRFSYGSLPLQWSWHLLHYAFTYNKADIGMVMILYAYVLLLFFFLWALFSVICPSGCVNVVAVWLKLGGSLLTSLWSYLYLWFFWISLLKAFPIHCRNKWEQLQIVSPEASLHLKNPGNAAVTKTSCNFFSKSQNPCDRQQGDGFKGYKSFTVRLNHKVE